MEKFLNSLTYQQIYPIIINANLLETADLEYFKVFFIQCLVTIAVYAKEKKNSLRYD